MEEDSSQEAHETSVSTEIYDGESLEVNTEDTKFIEKPQMEVTNRIVLTTPKAVIAETKKIITKETVTAAVEVASSKGSGFKDWNLEISEYEKDPILLNSTVDSQDKSGEFTIKLIKFYFEMFDIRVRFIVRFLHSICS